MGLIDLSAADLLARIAGRDLSCVEVMNAALDRIDAVNGKVNAIVSLRDRAALIGEAEAADRSMALDGPSGPLHGLPVAVKDLANVAGLPTSMGSPIMAGQVAQKDDLAIARMRAAGAIFIGKTNTPEYGLGSHTFNPVHGATRNPYDLSRSAGGSSGGAAAALATRMQWACDGSDMMGSLRNPAGWNNVYGFRPSWGRVPPDPGGDVVLHPLSTLGPMARDVADLTLLLDVMSGPDLRVPFGPPAEDYLGRLDVDLRGRRIAWGGDWGGAWPMEPGVMAHCEAALKSFADLGAEVETIAPPMQAEDLWQAWIDLRSFAVSGRIGAAYANPETRAQLRDVAIWEVERGLALTPGAILRASAIRSRWYAVAADLFTRFDALVLPTAQCWPFPVELPYPQEIGGQAMDSYHRWMECVVPASLLGLPTLGLPAGFGPEGLPMGLQLIGRYGGDLGILQLGQGWHAATGWPDRVPTGL
ncbi:amidase [Pseudooceanicola sp.]|uniref:amidase n=1 Tax=Pseudooceanicola sp. TaxID=1914328 RepID=UPI00262880E9|nr:amidase [Pseudooceanicola sp.]MDF1855878.1 amidase [Pseudooceanicola sp.]